MDTVTAQELAYLAGQRLGRLATVDRRGAPQNSPVGFRVAADGTVRVDGRNLGASRKFVASVDPWRVRAVEIRGAAETLTDVEPPGGGLSREEIRIHPERIVSGGLDEEAG